MRLDPTKVRFVAAGFELGLSSQAGLRLVGKENNIQLLETALVVEGTLLKVGLLGLERLFRAALAEWTTVTAPYSRIERARLVRWPIFRLFGLTLLLLAGGLAAAGVYFGPGAGEQAFVVSTILLALSGTALVWRSQRQYEVRFRAKDGRRRKFRFRIADRRLARAFDARLKRYLAAAATLTDREPA